jgi:hypothetical protein
MRPRHYSNDQTLVELKKESHSFSGCHSSGTNIYFHA